MSVQDHPTCSSDLWWQFQLGGGIFISHDFLKWSQGENSTPRGMPKQNKNQGNKEFAEIHQPHVYPGDVALTGDASDARGGPLHKNVPAASRGFPS